MISQGGGRVGGTRKAGREHPSVFSNSQGLTPTCTYMQDAVLGSDPCSSLRPGPPLLPRGSLTRAGVLGPELVSPWQNVLPDSRELQSQCSSSRLRSTTDPLPLLPPSPATHTHIHEQLTEIHRDPHAHMDAHRDLHPSTQACRDMHGQRPLRPLSDAQKCRQYMCAHTYVPRCMHLKNIYIRGQTPHI